jgi:hypothetical protein
MEVDGRVRGYRQDVGWWVINALEFWIMVAVTISIFINSWTQHPSPGTAYI